MTTQNFKIVSHDTLEPDPNQPRRSFNEAALHELAASIKAHGIIVPIGVRPHPTRNHGALMIVKGERRWRAAEIAGLTEVPVVIEDLTDQDALEHQLVENSMREDVHPLEEAEAYQRLLEQCTLTMDELVERTGKSRSHLYARLKLTELAAGPRKAFLEGKLAASIAELIARIPVAKLQEQATKGVLGEGDWKDYDGTDVQPESIKAAGGRDSNAEAQPLSFRAARAYILKRYSTKLALASFSPTDVDLVPSAGACSFCPHRSGNQPELALPGLEKTPDDLCTNPPCFEAKTKAQWERAATEAKDRGLVIVEGKKAEAIFVWNGEVGPSSPYVGLETRIPYDLDPTGSGKTFGKLLGKLAPEVPRVLVQSPSGAPVELMVKSDAVKLLREHGKLETSKPEKPGGTSKANKEAAKKQRAKDEEREEIVELALAETLAVVANVAATDLGKKELPFWRWVARAMVAGDAQAGDADTMLQRRGLDNSDDLLAVIEKAKSIEDVRAVIAELLVAGLGHVKRGNFSNKEHRELFDDAMRIFGVDWENRLQYAKEERQRVLESATASADAAKAKKPAKKGGRK